MITVLFVIIVFTLILIGISAPSIKPPLKKLRVRCPEFATMRRVAFAFNPFRSPREKGEGIDVVFCSRFGNKPISCKKTCIGYCEMKEIPSQDQKSLFPLVWGILVLFWGIGTGTAYADHKNFTLISDMSDTFAFVDEHGNKNPTLEVHEGDTVKLVFRNGDNAPHILKVPDLDIKSERLNTAGETTTITFVVSQTGEFAYFCPLPGHRRMGMEGTIVCKNKRK